jgi:hypothetical protein
MIWLIVSVTLIAILILMARFIDPETKRRLTFLGLVLFFALLVIIIALLISSRNQI